MTMNRMHRRLRRLTVATVPAAIALILLAAPVAAATAVESGWWTSVPVTAPDADRGLLVQGGFAEPSAYAAVGYELEADEDVTGLVLTVADGSATTPGSTLRACPLTQGFQSASGQPMEEAPAYDCALEVTAAVSDDGSTYSFDLTSLQGAEALGVAVLPSAPTDRVVLQSPGPDAVESTGASADSPPGSPVGPYDTFDGPPPPTETSPPSDMGSTSGALTLPPTAASASPGAPPETAPVADDAPTGTDQSEQAASTGPALQAPPAIPAAARNGGLLPLLGVLLLAGLTATLWLRAGRGETTPLAEPG